MLRRQKTMLSVLAELGGSANSTTLVKLMFLLRQETELSEDGAFYDFVPYRFGPFSFALYRELRALERDGYLWERGKRVALRDETREAVGELVDQVEDCTRKAVRQICNDYGRLSSRAILRTVYDRYPWFAMNSELTDLVPGDCPMRREAPKRVYTIGYQGKSVDAFFSSLIRQGLSVVIDVRHNPVSRKYGFARSSLQTIAGKLGMQYEHLPQLGIPSSLRSQLTDFASYQRLLDRYERLILPEQPEDVRMLGEVMARSPAVLVCAEKDVRCCHRSRLAEAVSVETDLPVSHLD